MAWSINGSTPSETSYINGKLFGTGKNINSTQLNICYYYDLTNNNPPPPPPNPPDPPITFSYTDCFGNPQNINIDFGAPQQVCALVDSVSVPGGGSSSKGSRCTS
jgi:hypothetical protein